MGRVTPEEVSAGSSEGRPAKRRRARDRAATEADLLSSARRLLDRDGVLAGLNLREVAEQAGVNRGQIYQYFGSRRDLLRAALGDMAVKRKATFDSDRPISFAEWRRTVFRRSFDRLTEIRLAALLALDGDTRLNLFPALERALDAAVASQGAPEGLRADGDPVGVLVATASTYLGYAIFRDAFAEEFDVDVDELDTLMLRAFDHMLEGLTQPGVATEGLPTWPL